MNEVYKDSYFSSRNEKTSLAAKLVLGELREIFESESVLDLGCGVGTWASTARDLGARKVSGIDGPWVDEDLLEISKSDFTRHDLSDGPPTSSNRYRLTIWLENAEHLPKGTGEKVLDWVCSHSDCVLFSAAIPGQGGLGHQNEQWQSYWAQRFKDHGFRIYDVVRKKIWTESEIPYWYKQNIFLCIRTDLSFESLGGSKAIDSPALLDMVHPEKWNKQRKKQVGIKEALRILTTAVLKRIKKLS